MSLGHPQVIGKLGGGGVTGGTCPHKLLYKGALSLQNLYDDVIIVVGAKPSP